MSRSGYTDDGDDQWGLIRWRGAVKSSIRGARGQAFLRELAAAMDAMPEKELVANEFHADGQFCTLGVVAAARGIDLARFDPDDCREDIAKALGIAEAMAAEVMYENDDDYDDWRWAEIEICGPLQRWESRTRTYRVDVPDTAARRWSRMRKWVASNITEGKA